jgi:glucoamylase
MAPMVTPLARHGSRALLTASTAVALAASLSLGTAPAPAAASVATTLPAAALPAAALPAAARAAAPNAAPDGPGDLSTYDLARKDCLGTARTTRSKVWFTVADGVLSDVYGLTIDTTNLKTLQYVVTDGSTFTDLQSRDMTYRVRRLDRSGMACRVTSTDKDGRYRLVTDIVTDPLRSSVVLHTRVRSRLTGLRVYVRYDATMNGNGGGGPDNGGADDARVDAGTTALLSSDTRPASSAVNRDYAGRLHGALRADRPFRSATSGFVGTPSDGLAQLDAAHRLTHRYPTASLGNVVQTARVDVGRDRSFTLALGYGHRAATAVRRAGTSARVPFALTYHRYAAGWRHYDAGLHRPPAGARSTAAYYLSANVLKASEDKTFPGAVVASLASPWGQAVSAGGVVDGLPTYFGSYREVFGRDLYQAFTGLLAAGDRATARATTRFLFERQQLPDGRMPRNSLVNGKKAPDTGGDQLDETAFPILMAWQSGLTRDATLYRDHIERAADFVVAHGPSFGSERWEEQGGYSPSTIAAQIAGLVAAGRIADRNGDHASARVYRATADEFARSVKGWTVTTNGPLASRYFLRLSKDGDPDAATTYNLGNGSVDADQRTVVDAGFLELTRLGILPARDPDVTRSLAVVDHVIRRGTPTGSGFYRYGTPAAGSEDGYGDCWVPDPTTCSPSGKPWPTGNAGSGHLWPVLAGERAEQELQVGRAARANRLLRSMKRSASGVGLVPEQEWEDPRLARSPYGTDPTTASIGFRPGHAAGSASPLTWAQAQEVRLIASHGRTRPVEQPRITRSRYVTRHQSQTPLTVDSPADGAQVPGTTTTVSGHTVAGPTVDVSSTAVDSSGDSTTTHTRAGADGGFSVDVATPFGSSVITVAATGPHGGTGYEQRRVSSDAVTGTTVLDVTDPDGDDHGPGTFAYPTAGDFHDGAFDLQRFQVIDAGDTVYLRTRLRDLSPTFGAALGAQLLDVYVHRTGGGQESTSAAYASRGYRIADQDAWSRRIEVRGFADPEFVDAAGHRLGGLQVQSSAVSRYITIGVPKASIGRPGPGWSFAVVLHGQDGFGVDHARVFTPTPGPYTFGLCPASDTTSPVCATDPASAPKAMDVLTPEGVSQSAELGPTDAPVEIRGVPVAP